MSLSFPVILAAEGFFDTFLKRTLPMTPQERAVALEDDDEVRPSLAHSCPSCAMLVSCRHSRCVQIEASHEEVAQAGQSAVVAEVNSHFIAFV